MLICPFFWIASHYTFVIHLFIFRSKEYISCFCWRSRGIRLLAPSISQHQLETIGRKVSNPHQIYSGNLLVLIYPVGSMYGIRMYTVYLQNPQPSILSWPHSDQKDGRIKNFGNCARGGCKWDGLSFIGFMCPRAWTFSPQYDFLNQKRFKQVSWSSKSSQKKTDPQQHPKRPYFQTVPFF